MAVKDLRDLEIKYIKGIGPHRAELLKKELNISTAFDLIHHFPSNHIDRTSVTRIKELAGEEFPNAQIRGHFITFNVQGEGLRSRLIGLFTDGTATIEIVWFRKIKEIRKFYDINKEYILFGNAKRFKNRWSMVHPEIEDPSSSTPALGIRSVYPLTEKLRNAGITSRNFNNWINYILQNIDTLDDVLPLSIIRKRHLMNRHEALLNIHFPSNMISYSRAVETMKYEELFFIELNILRYYNSRNNNLKGYNFSIVGSYFHSFYNNFLPFELTDAQKRVIKEIRNDMKTGRQMNRLLQGDVGSGKTMVALLTMLIAIDNGYQACLMAPTEILATQHYLTLRELAAQCGVSIELLTGSTKKKEREELHARLENGEIKILVGTHALIEDTVIFKKLGLAIIDEQHRFGVAQRSKLWGKNKGNIFPHVLVMTATPIPRTLAMTVYGDLDVSVIDCLPPGRKPIKTLLRYEEQRMQVYRAIGIELAKGRQVYVVYPLIEENEKLNLKSLEEGYNLIKETFPSYKVAMVHGRMKPAEKDHQMKLFIDGKAQILVSTTVIEVGVNVPNASTMVIENAERFGLSQLHQLRGRVGRGAEQSYCVLMTKSKITKETRRRLEIMTETTDGFIVAEADLHLRGPGDIEGTLQSGILFNLRIASLATDGQIIQCARDDVKDFLAIDPTLTTPDGQKLTAELYHRNPKDIDFSLIS